MCHIYITFIYNMNFLSIFFGCSTLFTDTVSNILLRIGVMFSVFLGYGENLQDLDVRLQCGQ